MKKLIVLISLLVMAVTAYSQQLRPGSITITPKMGVNASSYFGDNNEGCEYKTGFTIGAEGEYYIKNWLGISAGLMYSQQGCSDGNATLYNAKICTEYINIPLLCNFHFGKCFSLKAGLQPGVNLSAKAKVGDVSADLSRSGVDAKTFDIAMPIGMSFAFNNLVIDARYALGLTTAFKGKNDYGDLNNADLYNSVFSLTLGYRFNLK